MRKIITSFHMSLDNVVSNPEKWMLMSDDILKSAMHYYEQLDTAVFGSKTYPLLAGYWTNAEQTSVSDIEKQFAQRINGINKIVLSRSNVEIVWQNSELLKFSDIQSLSESLEHLKQLNGKNISVESGVGLWKLFLKNSFFDELVVSIHPVIVGKGDRLFLNFQNKEELILKSHKIFNNGVVELHYTKSKNNLAKV
ncbi:dihydrofolate reductase family protein [Mariniflexile litorale]|uniref:Dihydrofolate reductase family protein n=1 Tax=Mariniflexile litorale TaxID=3045158 RepID=A0AAU7ECM5_9FLAO|nr:dihydrofolate reductase family protein [Mariniflexile sp. KMM 9835]MDQ8213022.1 dihydrofolate reductase family protein [Mariniflexile sp. KMM 9835]